jgi:hypothetical protein
MIVKKTDFYNLISLIDNIEKVDFSKLDLSELFDNLDIIKMRKIKKKFHGLENIKIIRLLFELESIRNEYNIKIK